MLVNLPHDWAEDDVWAALVTDRDHDWRDGAKRPVTGRVVRRIPDGVEYLATDVVFPAKTGFVDRVVLYDAMRNRALVDIDLGMFVDWSIGDVTIAFPNRVVVRVEFKR
jgi:hypothetical protein